MQSQWSFDDNGRILKLVTEAQRIRWAHLFDPYLAPGTTTAAPNYGRLRENAAPPRRMNSGLLR